MYRNYFFQITDDVKTSTFTAVSSITALCKFTVIEEIEKNMTKKANNNASSNSNNTATKQPIFVLPKLFLDNLCPNDCSGNGNCVNSSCICFENYTSIDCSIEKGGV